MNETSLQLLKQHFKEATQELLENYNVEMDSSSPNSGSIELVATLGFGSDRVAGAIALCTSARCADYLVKPIAGRNGHDWLGELANQLLGRFKRRCARHGITFAMGVPVLFRGERISMARNLDMNRSIRLAFQTPGGNLEAWLDFKTSANVEFLCGPIQNDAPSEGEILLF